MRSTQAREYFPDLLKRRALDQGAMRLRANQPGGALESGGRVTVRRNAAKVQTKREKNTNIMRRRPDQPLPAVDPCVAPAEADD